MRIRQGVMGAALGLYLASAWSADEAPKGVDNPSLSTQRAVINGNQVVQILDQTVDWYRTLGMQQQSSSQPSDLLIYYANQQTATQVVGLAFDIARANAELLSSDASAEAPVDSGPSSSQSIAAQQTKLKTQRQSIQAEMAQRKLQSGASSGNAADSPAKLAELQGELDMTNARLNLLDNMQQFATASTTKAASVNALKAHIEAIAAAVPTTLAQSAASAPVGAANASKVATPLVAAAPADAAAGGQGIWEIATRALKLHAKVRTIDAIDRSTAALEQTFHTISNPPQERLKTLSAQSDALAAQADAAHGVALKAIRDQLDTLAWLFQQTSQIWVPLGREEVLLEQYRHNLKSWRETVQREYGDALEGLGIRVAILIGMLLVVFGAAHIWRRIVIRYTLEPRRRYQLLLIQKLTLWTLVLLIIALTFVTQISTFATFAGLITAGLAVAMQNVLLSIVGYFFLIGKYGLRVGDRVQIGTVTGEVISLGLVRLHLLELNSQGSLGASGRIVAFANSIVFQAASGLFRQLPGVDIVWHEATLSLPARSDYAAIKAQLLSALSEAVGESHPEFARQAEQIGKATASTLTFRPAPQVQLRFTAAGVEALVRYPLPRQSEAEAEERVSRAILQVYKGI